MTVDALHELDDGNLLTASLGIDHDKRLTDIAGLHVIHLTAHLDGEVGHLEAAAVSLLVEHVTVVVARLLVLRNEQGHLVEGLLARHDVVAHRVQSRQCVGQVLVAHLGTEQDVTCVDAIAALLDKLDDVEAVVGLDNVRHTLAVVQVECRRGILGQQHRTTLEARLTAIDRRGLILTVEDGQRGELTFATVDLLGIVTQTRLHLVDLLLRNHGVDGDNLGLDLHGDERQRILGQTIVVLAHIGRRGLHVLGQVVLYLLDAELVAVHLVEFFTQSGQGHAEVLLHLLLAAQVGNHVIDAVLDLGADCGLLHLNRIDASLVQEEFVKRHLLGDDTVGIAVDGHTLDERLLVLFLDLTLENGLIAYHPRNLLGHIILRHRGYGRHSEHQC